MLYCFINCTAYDQIHSLNPAFAAVFKVRWNSSYLLACVQYQWVPFALSSPPALTERIKGGKSHLRYHSDIWSTRKKPYPIHWDPSNHPGTRLRLIKDGLRGPSFFSASSRWFRSAHQRPTCASNWRITSINQRPTKKKRKFSNNQHISRLHTLQWR